MKQTISYSSLYLSSSDSYKGGPKENHSLCMVVKYLFEKPSNKLRKMLNTPPGVCDFNDNKLTYSISDACTTVW